MPPTLSDRLHHVLQAIENIERFLQGKTRQDFESDQLLRLAVERSLEIISEASRRLPADVKKRETQIAWQRMADSGNLLRHAYHGLNPEILCGVLSKTI
jgi:uncharacterized protein with HEPN domain